MSEVDTYELFVKLVYTVDRADDPVEQAAADQQLFMEDPPALMDVIRRGYEDEQIEIVVVHGTTDVVAEAGLFGADMDSDLADQVDADWG